MRKLILFMVSAILCFGLTSCTKKDAQNKKQATNPPEISLSSDGEKIGYIVGLNTWNGASCNREDSFKTIMKKDSGINIPYILLNKKINLEFMGAVPDKYELTDYILLPDGTAKYTESEIKIIPFQLEDNKGSFPLEQNFAAFLSYDMKDYEMGKSIRGFKLNCTFGENTCEYAFVVWSDAKEYPIIPLDKNDI